MGKRPSPLGDDVEVRSIGSLTLSYAMILFSQRLSELPTRGSAASGLVTVGYGTVSIFTQYSQLVFGTGRKRNVRRTRSADGKHTPAQHLQSRVGGWSSIHGPL